MKVYMSFTIKFIKLFINLFAAGYLFYLGYLHMDDIPNGEILFRSNLILGIICLGFFFRELKRVRQR